MTFNINKFGVGDIKKATTLKKLNIVREDKLFVQEWGKFIPCAPYDNHFIYYTPEKEQSAYMCTCGSPAVVVPPEGANQMFVCLFHATYGKHTTNEKRWI